jgi:hypothetical protein
MRALIAPVALAIALGTASAASAQSLAPTEPAPSSVGTSVPASTTSYSGPTVWGILGGWYGGFGVGGRYMLPLNFPPLINNGQVRDSFALEFGADFLTFSYAWLAAGADYRWNALIPVVGGMWNIWLNDKLAFYPKLDLGYMIGWFSNWNGAWGPRPDHGWLFWNFALGGMYRINNNVALRGELGYAGLKFGASFLF